jgi:hypothetical protein
MSFIDELAVKIASAPHKDSDVASLLKAKSESDRRRYPAKHEILRRMIVAKPHNFEIDSEEKGIVGLSHRSGFKIHIPRTALPTVKLRRRPQAPPIVETLSKASGFPSLASTLQQ